MDNNSRNNLESSLSSWTDDLPICRHSAIGTATNELYRKDGRRLEMHPNEDRSFHFNVDDFNLTLLGVFDGFDGSDVADFAVKKMPAEILLEQLSPQSSDESVKEVLRIAFNSLDREYFEGLGEIMAKAVAERGGSGCYRRVEALSRSGASATVAVILNENRLFIGNVGDTRAVLCTMANDGSLKAIKLSIDHVLGTNEDEELRLRLLGLDPKRISLPYTRCLGFHKVKKGGYKEIPELKGAKGDPVLSDPEIQGGIPIQDNFQFMLIYSRPVFECLSELTPAAIVDSELCRITFEEFRENTTITGVAQSVVDKIVRIHREHFEMESGAVSKDICRREDISLLVRNFKCVLGTSQSSATLIKDPRMTRSSTTTEGSSSDVFIKQSEELPVDENGRIESYVDFTHFHREWKKYQEKKQNNSEDL